MRKTCTLCIGVTFPFLLGNAQDDAALTGAGTTTPAEAAVAMGYAAQGNVAMNQAQKENEVQAALQQAREKRALQQSMATYVEKPEPTGITAEQFFATNRSLLDRRSGSGDSAESSRQRAFVPQFENQTGRADSGVISSAEPAFPSRRPGLFDRMKLKKSKDQDLRPTIDDALAPPPAEYPTNMVESASAAEEVIPGEVESDRADSAALSGVQESGKTGFLSKLFKREKDSAVSPAPVVAPAVIIPPVEESPAAGSPGGIPSPPGFDDATAPSVTVTPAGSN